MGVIEIVLMGVGLAMDAFAVAVCKGLAMRKVNMRQCFLIALFFGGFQALMPFLGWLLGRQFADSISALDHWVAFVLLGYIGGKMIYEAIKERAETVEIEQLKVKREGQDYLFEHVLLGLYNGRITQDGSYRLILHPALLRDGRCPRRQKGKQHDSESSDAGENTV